MYCGGILSCAGVYCINTIRWSNDRPLPPHYGLRHSWTNAKKGGKVWIFSRKKGKSLKCLFSLTKTLPTLKKNWICWRSWGRIRRREWRSRRVSYLEQTLMNLTGISGTIFPIFYQCFPPLWSLIFTSYTLYILFIFISMNLTGITGTIFPIYYQWFPPLWSLIYT